MLTKVLNMQRGEEIVCELTPLPMVEGQTFLFARIKDWDGIFAQLSLNDPKSGWMIFPN